MYVCGAIIVQHGGTTTTPAKTLVIVCGRVCLRVFGRSFADDVVVVKCRLESEAKDDISVGTVYSRWLCMVAAFVQFYSKNMKDGWCGVVPCVEGRVFGRTKK